MKQKIKKQWNDNLTHFVLVCMREKLELPEIQKRAIEFMRDFRKVIADEIK